MFVVVVVVVVVVVNVAVAVVVVVVVVAAVADVVIKWEHGLAAWKKRCFECAFISGKHDNPRLGISGIKLNGMSSVQPFSSLHTSHQRAMSLFVVLNQ